MSAAGSGSVQGESRMRINSAIKLLPQPADLSATQGDFQVAPPSAPSTQGPKETVHSGTLDHGRGRPVTIASGLSCTRVRAKSGLRRFATQSRASDRIGLRSLPSWASVASTCTKLCSSSHHEILRASSPQNPVREEAVTWTKHPASTHSTSCSGWRCRMALRSG